MLNKVILIGRVARDPELKWTPSGLPVANFTLAVDRPNSAEARQAGKEKETDFVTIVAWRQSAEFASNNLTKGRLVAVDGRLQIRQWKAQDGSNRSSAEVVVDKLEALDKPNSSRQPQPPQQPQPDDNSPSPFTQNYVSPQASPQQAEGEAVDDPFSYE